MDASWPETTLDDLEATAGTEYHVIGGNSNVVEADVAVSVGSVVETDHRERTMNRDARCVNWDQNNRLLLILVWVCGIGLAHDDEDLVALVAGPADPPFLNRVPASMDWGHLWACDLGPGQALTCPFST